MRAYIELKIYDWSAYPHIHSSEFVTASEAALHFPMLRTDNLTGAVVGPSIAL